MKLAFTPSEQRFLKSLKARITQKETRVLHIALPGKRVVSLTVTAREEARLDKIRDKFGVMRSQLFR